MAHVLGLKMKADCGMLNNGRTAAVLHRLIGMSVGKLYTADEKWHSAKGMMR